MPPPRRPPHRSDSYPALIFSLFGLVFGLLTLRTAAGEILLGRASQSWPTTRGKITKAIAVKERTGSGHASCALVLRYSYRVGDQEYMGHRYQGNMIYSHDQKGAEGIVNDLLAQDRVQVWYDPAVPASSVLRPGLDEGYYWNGAFGALVTVGSLFGLWYAWRTFRRARHVARPTS